MNLYLEQPVCLTQPALLLYMESGSLFFTGCKARGATTTGNGVDPQKNIFHKTRRPRAAAPPYQTSGTLNHYNGVDPTKSRLREIAYFWKKKRRTWPIFRNLPKSAENRTEREPFLFTGTQKAAAEPASTTAAQTNRTAESRPAAAILSQTRRA